MIWSIQALRGFSVLLVILYHTKTPFFENGYLGVDLFFIISGFIITNGILKNQLSVIQFLKKRALRLLPSLYIVLISVITISLFFDPPHITKNLGEASISSVLYFTNLFYYLEIDYFNDFHNSSPLLHLWSLSVEEQFYFILPIVFLFLRPKKRYTIWALTSIAIISFLIWFSLKENNLLGAFYFPHTRFWELLIGVIIAIIPKRNFVIHSFYSILFFVLSIASIVFFNINFAYFFSILFTTILLYFSDQESSFFNNPFSNWGGKLSYNIYLWHQPVIYYLKESFNNNNLLLILLITLIFSYTTHRFVEEPIRNSKNKFRIFGILIISIILLLSNYQIVKNNGLGDFKTKFWNSNLNIENRDSAFIEKNIFWTNVLNEKKVDSSILIIGDSKGEDLLVSIKSVSNKTYNFYKLQTYDYNNNLVKNELEASLNFNQLKFIVFTNTWKYLNNKKCAELINLISKQNPNVQIVVLSTCNFEDVSSLAFLVSRKKLNQNDAEKLFFQSIRDDWKRQSNELKSLLNTNNNILWLDKENAFCHGSKCKLISIDGRLYIYDTGHVTLLGAKTLGDWFLKTIKLEF